MQKTDRIAAAEIDKLNIELVNRVNNQMGSLQKKVIEQKNAEEQARLRKIQEELERERKRKEEEERKLREDEEIRKKKVELEARRKKEELERKKQVRTIKFCNLGISVCVFCEFL